MAVALRCNAASPSHSTRSSHGRLWYSSPQSCKESLPCGGLSFFIYAVLFSHPCALAVYMPGFSPYCNISTSVLAVSVWQALILMLKASRRGREVYPVLCRAVFGVWRNRYFDAAGHRAAVAPVGFRLCGRIWRPTISRHFRLSLFFHNGFGA